MPVSFPGAIPIPRGMPYPEMKPQGNMWSDVGGAMRQGGADIDQARKTLSEEEMQAARITEMVDRRKMAMAAQRAKEEFQQKDMEFKAAQAEQDKAQFAEVESRRVGQETRMKEKSDLDVSEKNRIAEERAALNRELYDERKAKGKDLTDDEVKMLAYAHGRGEEWEKFTKRRPPSNNYYLRGADKVKTAKNSLKYRESELYTAIKDFNAKAKKNFTSSILKKDFAGIENEIIAMEKETEKRNSLKALLQIVRKSQKALNDAKIAAQLPFKEDENTEGQSEEIQRLLRSIENSKQEMQSRGLKY